MTILISLLVMVLLASKFHALELKEHNEVKKSLFSSSKNFMSKRTKNDDVKYFEGISEISVTTTTEIPVQLTKRKNKNEGDTNSFSEIKLLLAKLLDKIDDIEKDSKRDAQRETSREIEPITPLTDAPTVDSKESSLLNNIITRKRKTKERKKSSDTDGKQRWGKWTNWSPCSVSCGKGREIRWRHCLENCDVAETEMEEKTCQLPACGPTKLFGVIKL